MSKFRRQPPHIYFLLYAVFPVLVGSFLYLFRPSLPLLVDFLPSYLVNALEDFRKPLITVEFPLWIIYNLPDFLWLFSMQSLMLITWGFKARPDNLFWLLLLPAIAVLSEIGQHFHLIPGRFDWADVAAYMLASIFSAIQIKHPWFIPGKFFFTFFSTQNFQKNESSF